MVLVRFSEEPQDLDNKERNDKYYLALGGNIVIQVEEEDWLHAVTSGWFEDKNQ